MVGLRPDPGLYLERPRLLEQLPDAAGYVVWLEAPYGHGKSVLAAQWAWNLEREGWRVLWLSLNGQDARGPLATLLNLPPEAPWGVVLEALWREPTLLVLEDIEGDEAIDPLLAPGGGLLLLASRHKLNQPGLLKAMTEGWLIHLGANQLTFTSAEATALFGDADRAQSLWQRARGWALPLHFSALTGEPPEREALLEGMHQSLSEPVWREALLLAAVPFLPREAAVAETLTLTEAGFAQSLEDGYRLHPLVAEVAEKLYPNAVREAVLAATERLPAIMRGNAFETLGLLEPLADLLEQTITPPLPSQDPAAVMRWDMLAPAPSGHQRRLSVARALSGLGRLRESAERLAELGIEIMDGSPDRAISALGNAAHKMATVDPELAISYAEEGMPHVERAQPHLQAGFFHNIAWAYFQADLFAEAERYSRRALELFANDDPHRMSSLHAHAFIRWKRLGDLEGLLAGLEQLLPYTETTAPEVHADTQLELGRHKRFLNLRAESLEHFRAGRKFAAAQPLTMLEVQAEIASGEGDTTAFPRLLVEAERWEDASVTALIRTRWAQTLREQGNPAGALEVLAYDSAGSDLEGRIERALALAALGSEPKEREQRLPWWAAHYRLGRDPADLERLVALTLSGAQVLPGLIPFDTLPRERPELASSYPLAEVLASGWKEAIALRSDDIPALELTLMGEVRAGVLGQQVELTARHQEILALLALGYERGFIGATLWPEADTKKVRNNLNVQLNLLRKVLEPWGLATYLLEEGLTRTRSDLWDLQNAIMRGDADKALDLYQPPLAAGLDLPPLEEAREQLRAQVTATLFETAEGASADRASALLIRVLELDPVHEEALQLLLRNLIARGRRREAQRRYQTFARRLEQEMGLTPLPETRELVEVG